MTIQEMLIRDEGLKLMPYRDTVGKLTIGVGRNLDDCGISKEEALVLLANDIEDVTDQLADRLPFYNTLPDPAQMVLQNMCFNMGINRLLKFKLFLGHLQHEEYKAASVEMLDSVWAGQVGQRAIRLSNILAAL